MWLHPVTIGNVTIPNNLILAPMAGISDLPFRLLCKEKGAGLVYTEMISSKGMFYDDKKTKQLLQIEEKERPVAVQIFGSDPEIMGEIAKEVSQVADILDINMGCPAPKVTKNGEGSKLLLDLERMDQITKAVVANSRVPVTIKIRTGWDSEHLVAVEVAKIAEKNGVAAITVHGRTREQLYTGKADWEMIRRIKEAVSIPVIGNGDVVDGASAKAMLEQTGCDAVMIGRASQGNPWIFEQILSYLTTGKESAKPSKEEIKTMVLRHLDLLIEEKGEYTAIREMRKQIGWYSKGLSNATSIRQRINQIEEVTELKQAIQELFSEG